MGFEAFRLSLLQLCCSVRRPSVEPYDKLNVSRPTLYRKNFLNGAFTGYDAGPSVQNYDSSLSGEKNPQWRDQVSQHVSASTPCSGISRSLDPGWVDAGVDRIYTSGGNVGKPFRYSGSGHLIIGPPVSVPALPSPSLDNLALSRFYDNISGQINQSQGLVALGELRETVRALKHPFKAMTDLLVTREKRLKGKWNRLNSVTTSKRRKVLGRDLKSAAAGTWLEAQFHLKPLVSDIVSLVQFLNERHLQVGIEYLPIRGTAREVGTPVVTESTFNPGVLSCQVLYRSVNTRHSKVRYKGELRVDPLRQKISWRDWSRLGFSLRQFLPTIWELTPWSFLVDYFLDVGGLINSFNVPREDIAWYNKTSRSEKVFTRSVYGRGPAASGSTYHDVPDGLYSRPASMKVKTFERSGFGGMSLPRPSISLDLPNGLKLVNIFAIAASDSKRRFSFHL